MLLMFCGSCYVDEMSIRSCGPEVASKFEIYKFQTFQGIKYIQTSKTSEQPHWMATDCHDGMMLQLKR